MKISPQHWPKVSELLGVAMEMPAGEREAWLKELTNTLSPDERVVIEPLRKLLAQEARIETDDILGTPPDRAGALFADHRASEDASSALVPGALIGAYRLLRELGRGGMGSVWLAERIDGALKRNVALKFPYAGPQQRQLARRLLQERDILANLEHPNIARLYDADITDVDRPFLVLEYVDGIPIDEFCRTRRLPFKDRLHLFRQVFNAVQYAHTRLVIHRDLKPSNVLVTADGVVHLLDFGIAKVLAEGGEASSNLTEIGGRVLTPNFASPEQITNGELTTASDVYSLGIVLYELLTGARPYRLRRETRGSLEEAIAAADVVAPSEAARAGHSELDAARISKALRGDLDTILLKALKKNPEERYGTVAAFADDIERHLRGEPVMAQADSRWYRLSKFAARNRLAVGATLAVVASLGLGLTVALWQLHTARVAQKRAEDVKDFIASIFRSADPFFTGNRKMSAVELLTLARQRIDRELNDQPEYASELLTIVGESQTNLEEYAAAQATLSRAVDLSKQRLPSDDLRLAEAKARLAQALADDQNLEAARPYLAESIPILRKGGIKTARALSDALQFQAYVDAGEGNSELAIAESREAYEAVLAALGPKDSETILSKRHWAQQLLLANRGKEALPLAKQAFDESISVFEPGERNGLLPEVEGLYGRVLVETGELEGGIQHLQHAIGLATEIYGEKSTLNAVMYSVLMRAQMRYGDLEGMVATAKKSYEAALDERATARPLTNLGDLYAMARKFSQAEAYLLKAIEAEKKYDVGKGSWLPVAQAAYVLTLLQTGRMTEARAALKEMSTVAESKLPTALPYWNAAGLAGRLSEEWVASEQAYRKLLELAGPGGLGRWRADALNGIGIAQLELGRPQDAETSLRDADKAARAMYRNMTPTRADVLVSLARVLLQQKRSEEALPLIEEATRFWSDYDAGSRWAGEAAYWHGEVLLANGKNSEARDVLAHAVAILKKSPVAVDAKLAAAARARL